MANIRGTNARNSLRGTDSNDRIFGLGNADSLFGLNGNDLLDGGTGVDTMRGGRGNDTYVVDAAGDRCIEAANQGTDTVRASVTHTLGANVERLLLLGTSSINGNGSAGSNYILGNGETNILRGGDGADRLDGGAGEKIDFASYSDSPTGLVASLLDPADNTGFATGDSYSRIEGLIGSTEADTLVASDLFNTELRGGGGNDVLFGRDGEDVLYGEGGDDEIYGGGGVDSNDLLDGGEGNDDLYGEGGNDTIRGRSGLDTIVGGFGNDIIEGGADADTMDGGFGNDTFLGVFTGDVVDGGGDTDTISFELETGSISFGLGNVGITNVENLVGGQGSDLLAGDGAANVIDGGASGNDQLTGNGGNDAFVLHTPDADEDVINDFTQGTDVLQFAQSEFSISSLTLGVNLHNIAVFQANGIGAGPELLFQQNLLTLWYDADGVGTNFGLESVAVVLGGAFSLNPGDFDII
ncbi:MAG: calcium-binding protein [Hyphomicrobiaceae bacterium]|nr:calcium-binding protein [Hyphomicrobiaceae bacterium]